MAAKKAAISVSIIGDATQARAAFKQAEDAAGSLGEQMKSVGKTVAGAFATGAIVAFAKGAIQAAEESQVADQRLRQIATSMGVFGSQVEDVTDRISSYASQLSRTTGLEDEQIKLVQAKLLTFKDLATTADQMGGAFDRATIAAVDMAAAGFGSAETNAVALGKALQDPINGLTTLRRVGITFTESQKEMIRSLVETNRIGEAQAVILGVIEQKFGGTAEATVTESQRMRIAFSELQESVGLALLPAFEAITSALIPVFDAFGKLPKELQSTIAVGGLAAGAFKSLSTTIQGFGLAANTAKLAVAGVGSVIGLAIGIYSVYNREKQQATNRTNEFVAALQAEASGQTDATEKHIAQIAVSRDLDGVYQALGFTIQDVSDLIQGETNPAFTELETIMAGVRRGQIDLASANRDLGDRYNLSYSQVRNFVNVIDQERTALSAAEEQTAKTTQAVDSLTGAQTGFNAELADGIITTDEMTEALGEQESALQAVITATLAQFNAALAYESQTWNTKDAVDEYTLAQLEAAFGTNTAEEANRLVAEAANGAAQAALRQAAAAAKVAEDQAKAQGATLSAAEAAKIQIAELEKVAKTLSPTDPLRVRLNEYINELRNKIPKEVETKLKVAVTAYVRTVRSGDTPSETTGRNSSTGSVTSSRTARAFGGPVLANSPYLVGENGPELFVPRAGGQIIPNTGGSNVTINVYGSVVSERDLVEKIRQGLIDAQRSGRPVVFVP